MNARIRRAGTSDREAVVRLLDAAFQDDPVSGWLFPDEEHRRSKHPLLMGAFFDIVLRSGRVDVLADASAAALWLPVPEPGSPEEPEALEESGDGGEDGPGRLRAEIDPDNERIDLIGRLTAAIHPTLAHAYLWLIAVDPARQGEGLGTALIRSALDHGNGEGVPAYLEASSPSSRALYERLGFVDRGPALVLPDGPTLWPMWREPHVR
ncbi:GNAT family N-acetyltransferase [Streptomyces sp. NPDC014894]|uniref:GNAT family N-acetyltransferase n=1 Tax=Streptomyces sp. NPDC014894 TaxID=3364931 RepID=UPI0036FF25CB